MAVITGLVLILLGTAGARNIPLQEDAPLELPLELNNLLSDTKTSAGELVGRVVDEEDDRHLNKNTDGDETVEDHVYNVVSLRIDGKENILSHEEGSDYKEDKTDIMLTPVDTIEVQNKENLKGSFLEDRHSLGAGCSPETIRLGNGCPVEDLDNNDNSETVTSQE